MIVPGDIGSLVKILEEGDGIITNKGVGDNADLSVEYTYYRHVGCAVVSGRKYGKYTFG